MLKIGIIREDKSPPDSRVPLNPTQCKALIDEGIDLVVQSSQVRCFTDDDYRAAGVPVVIDILDRDILLESKKYLLINSYLIKHTSSFLIRSRSRYIIANYCRQL